MTNDRKGTERWIFFQKQRSIYPNRHMNLLEVIYRFKYKIGYLLHNNHNTNHVEGKKVDPERFICDKYESRREQYLS